MWRITGQASIVIIIPLIVKNRWKRYIEIFIAFMCRINGRASIVIIISVIPKNRWKLPVEIFIALCEESPAGPLL